LEEQNVDVAESPTMVLDDIMGTIFWCSAIVVALVDGK
jgi:hypothetical protein